MTGIVYSVSICYRAWTLLAITCSLRESRQAT